MRSLSETTSARAESLAATLWSTPLPSMERLRVYDFGGMSRPLRMASLLWNSQGCTGYSFFWDYRIAKLHAHTPGEDISSYNAMSVCRDAVWLHLPMDANEKVASIWQRYESLHSESSLIVSCSYLLASISNIE